MNFIIFSKFQRIFGMNLNFIYDTYSFLGKIDPGINLAIGGGNTEFTQLSFKVGNQFRNPVCIRFLKTRIKTNQEDQEQGLKTTSPCPLCHLHKYIRWNTRNPISCQSNVLLIPMGPVEAWKSKQAFDPSNGFQLSRKPKTGLKNKYWI